jgi:hypothetical protein
MWTTAIPNRQYLVFAATLAKFLPAIAMDRSLVCDMHLALSPGMAEIEATPPALDKSRYVNFLADSKTIHKGFYYRLEQGKPKFCRTAASRHRAGVAAISA